MNRRSDTERPAGPPTQWAGRVAAEFEMKDQTEPQPLLAEPRDIAESPEPTNPDLGPGHGDDDLTEGG